MLVTTGAWAEWCITEDAELGLRVFEAGYACAYLPRSYGKGLMPDTFLDYKKQRSRWAYGAIQILRHHLRQLIGVDENKLTGGQRYHFIAGWLPWMADGFNFFNVSALAWSAAMILLPGKVDPPLVAFAVLPVFLFVFKIAKIFYLYLTAVGANFRQTIGAILTGLALAHTIGMAVIAGLFTKTRPFIRTPKRVARHSLLRALTDAREESLIMMALLLAAYGISQSEVTQSPDLLVWVMVLLLQSLPYACALLIACISSMRLSSAWLGSTAKMEQVSNRLLFNDRDG